MDKRKILNNIVKPWVELNIGLSKPLALEPEQSDFIQKAEALSVFISHFPEQLGLTRKDYNSNSQPNQIMSDVADSSKHSSLSNESRNSSLLIIADFEFRKSCSGSNEFRFLRNCIDIRHAKFGEIDFMHCAKDAINYILKKNSLVVAGFGNVLEGLGEFNDKVKIDFNPSYGVNMNTVKFRFKTRNANGILITEKPPGENTIVITPVLGVRDLSKKN